MTPHLRGKRLICLAPGKTSKGVRKLREAEAKAGKQIVFDRRKAQEDIEDLEIPPSTFALSKESFPLDNIPSVSVSASPGVPVSTTLTISCCIQEAAPSEVGRFKARARGMSMSSTVPSVVSGKSAGVLDWNTASSGTAQWERTLW